MGKAKSTSAGLILFRVRDQLLEVLIGHMGGPFWSKKDDAGWSIPKGEYQQGEDPLLAAQREFHEEIGHPPPNEDFVELGELRQPSGKRIVAWAVEGDFDPCELSSNTFTMEWPPKSGQQAEFPEIDRAEWFDLTMARRKLVRGQTPFLELLEKRVATSGRVLKSRSARRSLREAVPKRSIQPSMSTQSTLF